MSKINTITNKLQKYILSQLRGKEFARFSDLKPPKTSSNTYSYHLKQLVDSGWILKTDFGYTLGARGLAHTERNNDDGAVRMQPNIAVCLLAQDGYGKVLLAKKVFQPHINHWELPQLSCGVADISVLESAKWAAKRLFKRLPGSDLRHVGDCYIRCHKGKLAIGSSLYHVIHLNLDEYAPTDELAWFDPLDIPKLPCSPGTEQIITRAFFNDDFFFEEYTVQLNSQESLGLKIGKQAIL